MQNNEHLRLRTDQMDVDKFQSASIVRLSTITFGINRSKTHRHNDTRNNKEWRRSRRCGTASVSAQLRCQPRLPLDADVDGTAAVRRRGAKQRKISNSRILGGDHQVIVAVAGVQGARALNAALNAAHVAARDVLVTNCTRATARYELVGSCNRTSHHHSRNDFLNITDAVKLQQT